ncbi:MAG: hypothetical protein RIC89_11905 [Pseudomonadales bacterium]
MQTLTRLLVEHGHDGRILTDETLAHLLPGEDQKRYNLVNRALKAGELARICRGVYQVRGFQGKHHPAHPFVIAQVIAPGSFVSAETALSYHGWIPESVRITISISPGVKSKHVHSAIGGDYEFRPLSVCQGGFLELVQRQAFNAQVALVAKPARALMDMVYLNKIAWQGLDWLTESLRIELDLLRAVPAIDYQILGGVYKHKRVLRFLNKLVEALEND